MRIELSVELKKDKYAELKREGERKGWSARLWTAAKPSGAGAAYKDGERGEAEVSGVAAGGTRPGEVPPVASETYLHPRPGRWLNRPSLAQISLCLGQAGPPWTH